MLSLQYNGKRRDGHFRITNLEGFESFRIRMDSDPLGSGLERSESFWIRLKISESVRIQYTHASRFPATEHSDWLSYVTRMILVTILWTFSNRHPLLWCMIFASISSWVKGFGSGFEKNGFGKIRYRGFGSRFGFAKSILEYSRIVNYSAFHIPLYVTHKHT